MIANVLNALMVSSFFLTCMMQQRVQRILDLTATDQTTLASQATSWTISNDPEVTGSLVSDCDGTLLLGGYNVFGRNAMATKVYQGLPSHDRVDFRFILFIINSWDGETMEISFDSVPFFSVSVIKEEWVPGNNICGNTIWDFHSASLIVVGSTRHTGQSLTIKFSTNLDEPAENESWGIREFSFVLSLTGTTIPTTYCTNGLYSGNGVPICTCGEGTVYSGGWCQQCAAECTSCFGLTNSDCFSCKSGTLTYGMQCVSSCPAKTYTYGTACFDCPYNCQVCSSSTSCSQCISGKYWIAAQNGCYGDCSLGCTTCSTSTSCQTCDSWTTLRTEGWCQCKTVGYYSVANAGCTGKCPTGCDICTSGTSCFQCATAKYYISNVNACSGICSNGCNNCTSDSVCQKCYSGTTLKNNYCQCNTLGFYYQTGSAGCTGKCPYGCDFCVNSTNCFECSSGKFWVATNQACTGNCSNGCSKCSIESVCQTCYSGTTLKNNYCQCNTLGFYYETSSAGCTGKCPYGCDFCVNSTNCFECSSGKFWVATNQACTGNCSNGCSKCSSESVCQTCVSGTTLKSSYCPCTRLGFYYVPGSGCTGQCPYGCEYCTNSTTCLQCSTGRYWIEEDQGCTGNCSNGCSNCTNSTVCLGCFAGTTLRYDKYCQCGSVGKYYQIGSGCTANCSIGCDICVNTTSCLQCSTAKFWIEEEQGCTGNCSNGCKNCTNSTICRACFSGTTLRSDGYCQCSSVGKYYQIGSGCTANCSTGCDLCVNTTSCFRCSAGKFWVEEDERCTGNCSNGCSNCTNSTVCLGCFSGTTLRYDGYCQCGPVGKYYQMGSGCTVQCPFGCDICVNSTSCLKCSTSRYWIEKDIGCTGNCSNGCSNCTNSTVCLGCFSNTTLRPDKYCQCNRAGYYYQIGSGCTAKCPLACNYCRESSLCVECIPHATFDIDKCFCYSPRLLLDNQCQCPAETVENTTTLVCNIIQYLNVSSPTLISYFSDLLVQSRVNPKENPVFKWDFTSNSSDTALKASLENYLQAQKSKDLFMSAAFLEPDIQYNITGSFAPSTGSDILSKTVVVKTLPAKEPQIFIIGGVLQTLAHSEENRIEAGLLPNGWPQDPSLSYKVNWTQLSGDLLNLDQFLDPTQPLLIRIPQCTFQVGKSYGLQVEVTPQGEMQPTGIAEATITTPSPDYFVKIPDGNRQQNASQDLHLQAIVSIKDNVCNQTNIDYLINKNATLYKWDCNKINIDGVKTNCTDPLNLFYFAQNSPFLDVPNSYFSKDIGIELYIKVTALLQLSNGTSSTLQVITQTSFTIVSSPDPSMSLACQSSDFCDNKFSPSDDGAVISNSESTPDFTATYIWTIDPPIPIVSYLNEFKITGDLDDFPEAQDLRVSLTVQSEEGNSSSTFFTLPINKKPVDGSITVSPTTGNSLSTNFFISTSGWVDEDVPFEYEFSYSYTQDQDFVTIATKQLDSFTVTQLMSSPSSPIVYLKVIVTDKQGASNFATTNVSVNSDIKNINQITAKIDEVLANQANYSPLQNFKTMTLLSNSLAEWEKTVGSSQTACPKCSGNGLCLSNDKCLCNTNYTLSDCSMLVSEVNKTTNQKAALIDTLGKSYALLGDPSIKLTLLNNINSLTKSPDLNSQSLSSVIENVLDKTLKATGANTVLSKEEALSLSKVVDNLLTNAGGQDCSAASVAELKNKTSDYLATISRSLLNSAIPGESPTVIQNKNFDISAQKSTLCTLNNANITTSPSAPSIQLTQNSTVPKDKCYTPVDVVSYAFADDMYDCPKDPKKNTTKKNIAIQVLDPKTGRHIPGIGAIITLPPGYECPEGTTKTPQGNKCIANNIDALDVKTQLTKMLENSNVFKFQNNLNLISEFKFWENIAVWTITIFTVWFFSTLYFIKVKNPNLCVIQDVQKNGVPKSQKTKAITMIMAVHPILNIYFYKDKNISKVTVLVIYYTRMMVMMAYSSLFPKAKKGEEFIYGIYLIAFKSLTVTPLLTIITLLIMQKPNNEVKKEITRGSKIKKGLGFLLAFAAFSGSFFVLFVLSASQTWQEQTDWTISFMIIIISDIFVSPFTSLAVQIIVIKAVTLPFLRAKPFIMKILSKIVNPKISDIHRILYTKSGALPLPKSALTSTVTKKRPLTLPSATRSYILQQQQPSDNFELMQNQSPESQSPLGARTQEIIMTEGNEKNPNKF